jgi:hypothetical protein
MPQTQGTCQSCQKTLNKNLMLEHLATCSGALDSQPLIQLHVEGAEAPDYWLDLDVKEDAKLHELDLFLREIWLECCGHLSSFTVGSTRYSLMRDDDDPEPGEKTFNFQIGRAIGPKTKRLEYEYDFGSTTDLVLTVTARGMGPARKDAVRLLARNVKPEVPCSRPRCKAPATSICSFCIWEGEAFACDTHSRRHTCGENEGWLPFVNSPRTGMCGYTGETALH